MPSETWTIQHYCIPFHIEKISSFHVKRSHERRVLIIDLIRSFFALLQAVAMLPNATIAITAYNNFLTALDLIVINQF